MKKLLALCLLATPLISFAELPGSASQTVTKNPFFDIAQLHLSSLPLPIFTTLQKPNTEEFLIFKKLEALENPTYTVPTFSKYEQIALSYALLAPHIEIAQEALSPNNNLTTLPILRAAHSEETSLLELLNRTHLPEGEVYLAHLLTHPLTDCNELKNRQNIIKTISENPVLYVSLEKVFANLQEHQAILYSLWTNESDAHRSLMATQYFQAFGWRWLNTSTVFQHGSNIFKIFGKSAGILFSLAGTTIATGNCLFRTSVSSLLEISIGTSVNFLLCSYGADFIKADLEALNYLHAKVYAVAELINAADALEKQINQNPALHGLKQSDPLHTFSKNKVSLSPKMNKLLSLIKTSTFKGEHSFFTLHGRIKIAYALLEEVKEELSPLFAALAEVDAYLSCATVYQEYKNSMNSFNFVEYLDTPSQTLHINKPWNPLTKVQELITDSITLSGQNNTIPTTYNAEIMLTLVLAQTIGMVPAQSMSLTPFSKIPLAS